MLGALLRSSSAGSTTTFLSTAYGFWFAKGEAERKVAAKPLATLKQRVRQLTRRSGGRGRGAAIIAAPYADPARGGLVVEWPLNYLVS